MEHGRGRQPMFELEEEREGGQDQGHRTGRRRLERGQPDDGGPVHRRGVHRRQYGSRRRCAPRRRRSRSSSARASPPGLGAGSDPEIGKNAALEDRERDPEGARGRRHGLRHRRSRRRHRHRLGARGGRRRQGARHSHRGGGDQALRLRGAQARPAGRGGHGRAARGGGHAHRHPEPAPPRRGGPRHAACSRRSRSPTPCCCRRCRASRT